MSGVIQRPRLLPAESAAHQGGAVLRARGHLGLKGVFPPGQIAALERAIQQVSEVHGSGSQPLMETSVCEYGQGWVFQEQLWRRSPWLEQWLLEGSPARLVCTILSRSDVWLLRDQTYFKRPGSEATPWHQDGTFIPVDGLQSLTLWIPLHPIAPGASPMHYIDGSHLSCQLQPCGHEGFDFAAVLSEAMAAAQPLSLYDALQPGDCLVHDTWTLHGSPQHQHQDSRLAFVVVYGCGEGQVAAQHGMTSCGELLRDQARLLRQANAQSCFPGLHNGDWAPGSATPFVRVTAGERGSFDYAPARL